MISYRAQLSVTVQYAAAGDDLPARPLLRRWVQAALSAHSASMTVVLRFVDEAESRALNRRHRRKDRPTNVLSFVYDDEHGAPGGDIVLCAPVLRREAMQQGKPFAAHCAHLVVHGMLHLQDYGHEQAAEAARMEAHEIAILAGLGFANPYAAHPAPATSLSRPARR
ncbi:MAG: rRNA maturation RNase YbeY [Pseudomonadota bacterium]|nr:rRNA maturation RNase YbeY [Pseudomonadota bacterium]